MTHVLDDRKHSQRPLMSRLRGMGRLAIVAILVAMGVIFYAQSGAGGGTTAELANLDGLGRTLAKSWAGARNATADALEGLAEAVRPPKSADDPS